MRRWFIVLMIALCIGAASVSNAQISTGNIYGTVSDQQGGLMPGVTVSVVAKAIGGAPRTTVTDAGGQFRFLNLDTATYTVLVELPGFAKQARDVIVNTGVNASIAFTLWWAASRNGDGDHAPPPTSRRRHVDDAHTAELEASVEGSMGGAQDRAGACSSTASTSAGNSGQQSKTAAARPASIRCGTDGMVITTCGASRRTTVSTRSSRHSAGGNDLPATGASTSSRAAARTSSKVRSTVP
jgi:hypothetical protein